MNISLSMPMVGLLLLALAGTARAGLVTNGGFETGDLTGWTVTQNGGWDGVASNTGSHGGTHELFEGSNGHSGFNNSELILSQTILSAAEQTYAFQGWFNIDAAASASCNNPDLCVDKLYWNGTPVATLFPTNMGYMLLSATVVGTGNDVIGIGLYDSTTGLSLADDISVAVVSPEPATGALLGLALLGLVPLAKKLRCNS